MRIRSDTQTPDGWRAIGARRLAALLARVSSRSWLAAGAAAARTCSRSSTASEAELEEAEGASKGVLSTSSPDYNDQVDQLAGEVAVLRNREAIVQSPSCDRVQSATRREKDAPRASSTSSFAARSTCSATGWSTSTGPASPTCSR